MVNQSQKSVKTNKTLGIFEDPGNGQLAAFRGHLKRLTSLTSILNIALKTVNFYSAGVVFNFMTFYSRIMTLKF